jgi:hypothetical protein
MCNGWHHAERVQQRKIPTEVTNLSLKLVSVAFLAFVKRSATSFASPSESRVKSAFSAGTLQVQHNSTLDHQHALTILPERLPANDQVLVCLDDVHPSNIVSVARVNIPTN